MLGAHALQLLQAAYHLRHRRIREAGLPVGDADFAQIDIALGVERDPVGREEFAAIEPGPVLAAEPADLLSLRIHNREARPDVSVLPVHRHAGAELADDEARLSAPAAAQGTGPVQVV